MIQYILYSYVRVKEHNVSQNEQTTLTSILRALIFLKNTVHYVYTCIRFIYCIIRLIDITYYYSVI